ncbi:MAG TPA: beta-ketoacyl-ACP synthase II [Chloroflexia bacterium]|nr:beta-ketoacyl-ACP synthase II [Chloroflexia bacterium]
MRRVVVTGMGALTPVGNNLEETWTAFKEGKPGVARITLFDPSPYEIQIGGEVKNFDNAGINPKELRHMDRSVQFAVVAAQEALRDAGYQITPENADRTGIIIGSAAGGLGIILNQQKVLEERGPRRLSPFFLANMLPDSASGQVAIAVGARGPNMAVASACATGSHAIGEAWETIRRGDADAILAGGTDAVIVPLVLAGFVVMRGLGNDPDPARACKPFDKNRNGFVLSEGCGILLLEDLEHAQARGARIYAEVIGYGSSNDAFDMFGQSESGGAAIRMMRMALHKAGIAPEDVDYIVAHGTGTPLNDRVETLAIKQTFGEHARDLVVSSFKSMTGHMMGASGAIGAINAVKAVQEGVIPPTTNYSTPDPDCDLDYNTGGGVREKDIDVAISNAIGLGGHNACVVVRKYQGT